MSIAIGMVGAGEFGREFATLSKNIAPEDSQ